MFREICITLLVALAASLAAPPDLPTCVCTFNYTPVCGSDGVTYSNECALRCAQKRSSGLEKQNNGVCPEKEDLVKVEEIAKNQNACICTRNFKPVCGTNGVTYNNPCLLNCARETDSELHVLREGFCEESQVQVVENAQNACTCTRNIKPVCGTNGVTYNNPCLLNCAQESNPELHVLREGFCEEVQVVDNADQVKVAHIPEKVKVVHLPDQVKVVDNADKVKVVENASQVHVVENAQNPCTCTRNFKPVCGTDGVTYSNQCLLICARSTTNEDLHAAHEGYC